MSLELLLAVFRDKGRPVVRRLRSRGTGDPGDDRVIPEPIDPGDDRVIPEPIDPGDDRVIPEPIDPGDDQVIPEPIDPGDDQVIPEPIDPADDRVIPEPIDPGDDRVIPEPIDPGDDRVIPEPIDPQVAALLAQACGCGCGGHRPRRRRRPPEYSGSLVVRLSEQPVAAAAGGAPPPAPTPSAASAEASALGDVPRCGRPDAEERFTEHLQEMLDLMGRVEKGTGEEDESDEGAGRRLALSALRELRVEPLARSVDTSTILELERKAAASDLPPRHSLTSYCRLDAANLPDRVIRRVVGLLNGLPWVDLAYRELAATDASLSALQHYLDRGPTGVGARDAWKMLDQVGSHSVRIVDLEQGWRDHDGELPGLAGRLFYGDNRADPALDPLYLGDHGAAVVGELAARHTTPDPGTQGIGRGFEVGLLSHFRKEPGGGPGGSNGHVADAVLAAIAAVTGAPLADGTTPPELTAGDVLLIEVQRAYRPAEIDHADFDALRLASAHGLVVVEAAGNGGYDLDAYRDERGQAILARGRAGYRESGAIVVGAATGEPGQDRLPSSCHGRRVDCFAWGQRVVTTGYGDLSDPADDPAGPFTRSFSGTSAAAPMVAGVAALVQAIHDSVTGNRVSGLEMRAILADPRTGTRQGRRVPGAIGVMPDAGAILVRLGLCPIVRLADTGDPLAPGAELAIAADGGGHRVKVCNHGTGTAKGVEVTVCRGPVAPLVFPGEWEDLGSATAVVPPGGVPVDVGPAGGPAGGDASFLALIDDGWSVPPSLPPGAPPYFRFGDLVHCLRRNPAQCVVDVAVPAAGAMATLDFSLFGCPGVPETFTFDVVRRLPAGAEIRLEAPAFLVAELGRGRAWNRVDPKRVRLPSRPSVRTSPVRLPAARQECRLVVEGASTAGPGNGIVLVQRWRGREVGRVTWRFV